MNDEINEILNLINTVADIDENFYRIDGGLLMLEEAGELATAYGQFERWRVKGPAVVDELADVIVSGLVWMKRNPKTINVGYDYLHKKIVEKLHRTIDRAREDGWCEDS